MLLKFVTCLFGSTCCIPELVGILTCCIPVTVEAFTVGKRICWIVGEDWPTIEDGSRITWFVPLLVDTKVPCLKTLP